MKKKDIILIAGILVVTLLSFIFIYKPFEKTGKNEGEDVTDNVVIVRVDKNIVGTYSLDVDGQYVLNGGTHLLVIEHGVAHIENSLCKDHYCEKQGKISKNNQTLTCLPYKLTVTVSNDIEPELDLVS